MTFAVSQSPVISETSATVAPPVGGIQFSVFPPLFSLGAVMGVATAPGYAPGVGVQLRMEKRPPLVLRRPLHLWWLDLLLVLLPCPVSPASGLV